MSGQAARVSGSATGGQAAALPTEFDRGDVTTVHQGDCHVTGEAVVTYSTVLGSCISACVRDVTTGVGGMNHFLLAEQAGPVPGGYGASARYGAFAMEQLINMVLAAGSGRKSDLEVKVFGGGSINAAINDIGARNAQFVREFLAREGYLIAAQDLGGSFARRVLYRPCSGRVFVKRLDSSVGASVVREELAIARVRVPPAAPDIELF